MAFEVDRLHRLISSRAGDEGVFDAFKSARSSFHSLEANQSFSPLGGQQGSHVRAQYPVGSLYDTRGFDQGYETSSLPLESSSCSTETESDEDDDLLESLAQQIAQSMLDDEEAKVGDTCAGVLEGNTVSEARDLANAELNEGRVSPTSWSSGSWSSGPLHPGSQSSSKGSSRVSSQVSSPSSAPSSGYQDAWETLYAAAGEVVRLKMNEEKKVPVVPAERPYQKKVLNQAFRTHVPQQTRSSAQGLGSSTSHSARRREENVMANNQAQQNWSVKCAAMRSMGSQGRSQYPQYQQHQQAFSVDAYQRVHNYRHSGKLVDNKTSQRNRQAVVNGGSGVRVVFLGSPSGRESGGTGVFLPRTFPAALDHKKKNEVTPVSTHIHGCGTGMPLQAKAAREGVWPTLQQSMNRSRLRHPVVHEPCLPTEWTY